MRKEINMNQTKPRGGSVRRFCDYNDTQLKQMKEDLKISATQEQLKICQDHYRALKRDPTLEELRFLDSVATLAPQADGIMLSELYTNHDFVADTYADMMNKRRELNPDADHPISLREALDLASAYLERAGKARTLDRVAPVFRSVEELDETSAGAQGSDVLLALDPTVESVALTEGDVFMLIHRGKTPRWKYLDSIGGFLATDGIRSAAKRSLCVSDSGLFATLLPLCDGVLYDLRAIAPDGCSPTPVQLVGKFSEYRVLAIKKEDAPSVARIAREYGFRPMVFAAVLDEPRTGLLYSQEESIFFETSLLRAVTARSYAAAKLPDENNEPCNKIQNSIVDLESCPYLKDGRKPQRFTVKQGVGCSAVCAELSSNPFHWALQAALTAILSTAVSGCPYSESRLAVSLRYPTQDHNRIGETVAAILGIYRLQCELGIPANLTELTEDVDANHPILNVFSVTPSPALPSQFAKRGTRLYCISPIFDANGLPDFHALRALLRELAEFCRQGDLHSVRILANQRLTDAMVEMETDTLTFHLTDHNALVGEALPLAILFESSALLPYPCVGYVKDRVPSTSEDLTFSLPNFEDVLNRGEEYEVLILSKQNDLGAAAFEQLVRGAGAQCTRLDETTTESQLARAMLSAQVMFLCGNVSIPMGKQTVFARRVLRAAGGTVLQLGSNENLPENFADHCFPYGISKTLFASFAKKNEKNESFS